MGLDRDVKAISKLLFVLLLLLTMMVGAILSYIWVIGYYIPLDRVYSEDITINVTECVFDYQNLSFFNVTIQCPTSYKSKEPANITQIIVSTKDGVLHDEIDTNPQLPYKFQNKGETKTFECLWNWGNYANEIVTVIVLVADGSGAAYEVEPTPLTLELLITAILFTPDDTAHFNITLYNDSTIYFDFTRITVTMENGTSLEISETVPSLPRLLSPSSYNAFKCSWNWDNYRGMNATITVYTSQGYVAYRIGRTSEPVILAISSVLFDPANTTHFNVTVINSEYSLVQVNITLITVTLQNGTSLEVTVEQPPSLPYSLPPDDTITFRCLWDWTDNQGENVIITVETLKGYEVSYPHTIPTTY